MKFRLISAQLIKVARDIRASYWFVPGLMVVCAGVLAFVTDRIDASHSADWLAHVPWLYSNDPAGARAVLAAIATSMIGVAGVTFSMTIVAVSFAAAQFGQRLIGNFMRDVGNQVTLGTFIATFVYCISVLRTITSGDGPDAAHVPHISILVALVLTLISILVLIYFIHHIPESINVSRIAAAIGSDLRKSVQVLFPEQVSARGPKKSDPDPPDWETDAVPVRCDVSGYLQAINEERILTVANEHDLVVRIEYRPGDFASPGAALLRIGPGARVTDEIIERLQACLAFGFERTPQQNVLFLVDQLIEILARALSPGVNDPYTAIACLDWLQTALIDLVQRDIPAARRHNDEGKLRFIAQPVDFAQFTEAVFGQSLQYVAADRNVAIRSMRALAEVIAIADRADYRENLMNHARALNAACGDRLPLQRDRDMLAAYYERTKTLANDESARASHCRSDGWPGGNNKSLA